MGVAWLNARRHRTGAGVPPLPPRDSRKLKAVKEAHKIAMQTKASRNCCLCSSESGYRDIGGSLCDHPSTSAARSVIESTRYGYRHPSRKKRTSFDALRRQFALDSHEPELTALEDLVDEGESDIDSSDGENESPIIWMQAFSLIVYEPKFGSAAPSLHLRAHRNIVESAVSSNVRTCSSRARDGVYIAAAACICPAPEAGRPHRCTPQDPAPPEMGMIVFPLA
ncbi:hypothetical protein ONZ51_g1141 [Trametes cubensis]|uniref:Uncharacterized protein n=1 Tax=Trametes cubensis TaxID=1111947 RepID=A0AAD7U3D2_9APHY|nr:hypothetical protein ONZ51_g1141 [Trametes cubensis]